jgi:pimeloyl-ACP methyl ester carboxylesterase
MLAALLASFMVLQGLPRAPVVPVDTMVDVGGYRLHFRIQRGSIPVTIVLESGGGATLERWSSIDDSLAQRTGATIVAYERAGFGRSELGPSDLSPVTQARQLGAALEQLRVPARRIFIGHSYGGLMAVLEAHLYPAQLAGVVLIDPMNTRFVDATGDFVYSTVPHITDPRTDGERAIEQLVRTFGELVNAVRP